MVSRAQFRGLASWFAHHASILKSMLPSAIALRDLLLYHFINYVQSPQINNHEAHEKLDLKGKVIRFPRRLPRLLHAVLCGLAQLVVPCG